MSPGLNFLFQVLPSKLPSSRTTILPKWRIQKLNSLNLAIFLLLNPVHIKVDAAVLNLGTALCPLAVHSAPPLLPLMSSRRLGRAFQWGNNVAVKQRGCDTPSTLRTPLPPSSLLHQFCRCAGAAPAPTPFALLRAQSRRPRVGLSRD